MATSSIPTTTEYKYILIEVRGQVGLITLNRPEKSNAICNALMQELKSAAHTFDMDQTIGVIIITGSGTAFMAGADMEEMVDKEFVDAYKSNMFANWGDLSKVTKPVIAAVNGPAVGGGCELALLCDIAIASDTAIFGQPEVAFGGSVPGFGGTQRLVRVIGKSKAMEIVLSGHMIDAHQAERDGLVSRVVPSDQLLDEAFKIANNIASAPRIAVKMGKEAVNAAYEGPLQQGLRFEGLLYWSSFATKDQKEGMTAYMEKRKPNYSHQ